MSTRAVYLDNAATTPVRNEVRGLPIDGELGRYLRDADGDAVRAWCDWLTSRRSFEPAGGAGLGGGRP